MVELSPEALRLKKEFLRGDMDTLERVSTIVTPTYAPSNPSRSGSIRRFLRFPHLPESAHSNIETGLDVSAPHTDPTRPDYLKTLI